MAFGARKAKLEAAKSRLGQAADHVPHRARMFRQAVEDLGREIEDMLRQWLPDPTRVETICDQTEELCGIADELGEMVREAIHQEQEVWSLQEHIRNESDEAVKDCVISRCKEWLAMLEGFGVRVTKRQDLKSARTENGQDRLLALPSLVHNYTEAVDQLFEAGELIDRVGKGPKTAALEAELRGLRERFLQQGPDPRWLEELERHTAPVRQIANTPPPPPPPPPQGLRDMRLMLPEARRWVETLRRERDEIQSLDDRLLQVDKVEMYQSPEVERLRDDVREYLDTLRKQAKQEREDLLRELAESAEYYMIACGRDPRLEVLIAKLRDPGDDHGKSDPFTFEKWKQEFLEVKRYFDGVAQTRTAELERHCDARIGELQSRIEDLGRLNLMDETQDRANRSQGRIEQIKTARGRDATLSALRVSSGIEEEIAQLERQANEDTVRHKGEKAATSERKRELEEAAALAGIAMAPIRELVEPPAAGLGRCFELLSALAAALDLAEQRFLAECFQKMSADYGFCADALATLGNVPGAAVPPLIGSPEAPASPRGAAEACNLYGRMREGFSRCLVEQAEILGSRIAEIRQRLTQPTLGRTEDIQEAQGLIDDIDSGGHQDEPDPSERVRGLNELCARCEGFFWRLDRDKREAEEKHVRLQRLWRKFSERDLRKYYPEHAARVTGLLMGIPRHPRDWKSMNAQLDEALRTLRRLEQAALRIAAAEIDEACRRVVKRMPAEAPAKRKEMQKILDLVRDCEGFPSSEARRQLQDLAEERSDRED